MLKSSLSLSLSVLLQWPLDYRLLTVEDARYEAGPLVEALESSDRAVVRQAIRALGRFERGELGAAVAPFLSSPDVELRIEAANALAQMKAPVALAPFLGSEKSPRVRSALYEAIGRLPEASEERLLQGLAEEETVRRGAIAGLERFYRTGDATPKERALVAIREAVRDSRDPAIRKLGLLMLVRASDTHRPTLETALLDSDPGVRRLAVAALKEWRDDPSPLVRYEALRAAADCRRAEASLSDPSGHVSLLAIDLLAKGCATEPLEALLRDPTDWRRSARALAALAELDAARARTHLPKFLEHSVWQARVYAAKAAKKSGDREALRTLRADSHPNVVAEALVEPEDAVPALESADYGLLVTALRLMKNGNYGKGVVPRLLETLSRVSAEKRHTSRDPRRLLLERLRELGDASMGEELEVLLSDFDPVVAALAAETIATFSGRSVEPRTKRFDPDPMPSEEFLRGLRGARAELRMREAGSFVVELLPEVAPLTAARFAQLAESGYYDGLTFHRIVPNFVIQGGSPGANEYVGTAGYLRDEVSVLSHERGTLGISTRGRDTGDAQIFVNLADNYRLDHDYTVFARVVEGMENVDAVLEGDVIEGIAIERISTR